MTKLKVLDLFSGIGGFSLGLERTGGFVTTAFCEIDKKAQLVLKKHWPSVPIFEDITKLKGEDVGGIDIICGGFPCQDISNAGKGVGLEGKRSGLWFQFHRLISELRPSFAIIENVSALRSKGLDEVIRSLTEIGYDSEWHCIPASYIGSPQQRDRIWIVAYPMCLRPNNGANHRGGGLLPTDKEWDSSAPLPYREQQELDPWTHGALLSTGESGSIQRASNSTWWSSEPPVGRVAHGVPNRVDRLKQLGNAVVPAIPTMLGKAILAHIKYN